MARSTIDYTRSNGSDTCFRTRVRLPAPPLFSLTSHGCARADSRRLRSASGVKLRVGERPTRGGKPANARVLAAPADGDGIEPKVALLRARRRELSPSSRISASSRRRRLRQQNLSVMLPPELSSQVTEHSFDAMLFVPPPRGGPLEHNCRERRVTPGSSSERRVPGRQEDQVVEIRAAKAERPAFTGDADPGVPAKLRLALAARRLWPGPGVFLIARRRIRVRHGAGAFSRLARVRPASYGSPCLVNGWAVACRCRAT
jgi:hypothetical protein